jgi:hypothetical protein
MCQAATRCNGVLAHLQGRGTANQGVLLTVQDTLAAQHTARTGWQRDARRQADNDPPNRLRQHHQSVPALAPCMLYASA